MLNNQYTMTYYGGTKGMFVYPLMALKRSHIWILNIQVVCLALNKLYEKKNTSYSVKCKSPFKKTKKYMFFPPALILLVHSLSRLLPLRLYIWCSTAPVIHEPPTSPIHSLPTSHIMSPSNNSPTPSRTNAFKFYPK